MATSLQDAGYDEIKVIGRGQYGKAHLVRSQKDQGLHIAKTIELTCLSKKEREAAMQEVDLLKRLDHPNIVEYKGNFFIKDTLVIVMQYCEGGDLASYIKLLAKEKNRMPEKMIMHYFVQVLQALQYIHKERILHRDLKTSNLFLMKKRSIVKLGDFGISRVLEGSIEAALTVVGTPYYMSPEVCENKPYTFKSDVWSLGCVLYELCMLKHAFSADNLLGLVYKIVSDKYEPIPKRYPDELNKLIQRMLEKNADKRPSVSDMLSDPYVQKFMQEYVQTWKDKDHAHAPPPPSSSEQPQSQPHPQPHHHHHQRKPKVQETPKEAAERRKREAADKRREELNRATKQSYQNTTVARRMKEAEFQTTRMGGMSGEGRTGTAASASASPAAASPTTMGNAGSATGKVWAQTETTADPGSDDGVEEDYFEEESEEESGSYSEDFCSEVDTDPEFMEDHGGGQHPGSMLSTVQEEQDFTRVMCNYEQDLARGAPGYQSPTRPRTDQGGTGLARSQLPPASMRVSSAPSGTTGQGSASPAVGDSRCIMDSRTRASHLEEELRRSMGDETFQKAFNRLYQLRNQGVDEKTVKREMEALVGKEVYSRYGLKVDQLCYQLVYRS